jgi:outer membrane protein assembly factor BamB
MKRNIRNALFATLFVSWSVVGQAQEWTRFRGPNGTGISKATGLPVSFTEKDFNWKVAVPGGGHSSPVLWGKKIFLTSGEEDKSKRYVLCLNAVDGKTLWTKSYDFKTYRHHEFNTVASATPAVDADRVYTTWTTHEAFTILALDHTGKEVWKTELGAYPTQHGGAASPILVGDLVIVVKEPEEGMGAILALDRKTGSIKWKRERASSSAVYSTPILFQPKDGPAELICTSTANGLTSLDPETGNPNWEVRNVFRARCVGSPVQVGDLLFGTAGNGGGDRQAVAVRPGSKKNGTAASVVYQVGRGVSYVPTPIVVGKHLFLWGDSGILTCIEGETGKQVYMERIGGNFFGSPVYADGKLWSLSTKGELVVVAASERFEALGRTDLGEMSHATPAIADGVLYLRTQSHLISVGGKKTVSAQTTRE